MLRNIVLLLVLGSVRREGVVSFPEAHEADGKAKAGCLSVNELREIFGGRILVDHEYRLAQLAQGGQHRV